MSEYVRVTKPGGYVGTAEMTWLRPPLPEMVAYLRRVVCAEALDATGWTQVLEEAGLEEVVGSAHQVDIPQETKGRFERYSCQGNARGVLKMLVLFVTDRRAREFLKQGAGGVSKEMLEVLGYGVFAGRKG